MLYQVEKDLLRQCVERVGIDHVLIALAEIMRVRHETGKLKARELVERANAKRKGEA